MKTDWKVFSCSNNYIKNFWTYIFMKYLDFQWNPNV